MTEKRFKAILNDIGLRDEVTGEDYVYFNPSVVALLNGMDNDLLNCRAENTKLKLVLKDVVNDLKRMNTKGYAEHIEKLFNLNFKGDAE